MRDFQIWEICLKIDFTEDLHLVFTEPPAPLLRMYLRLRIFATVTPLAEPDISSNAIEVMYLIA